MGHNFNCVLALVIIFLLMNSSCVTSDTISRKSPLPQDHHVHILSPELIRLWKGMGIPFSRADPYYSNIDTILHRNGSQKITLISMAYVYSSDEFGAGDTDVADMIRNENNYLAVIKSNQPGRVTAFAGIDPLHPGAMEEIGRCFDSLQLDGIKLHFNASRVYLIEPDHLQKIREVFSYASGRQIPVLLHFDNSHPQFGRQDMKLLADSIMCDLPFVDLQIAHFGTSGGFNDRTRDILDTYLELIALDHPIKQHRILFDISAVALDKNAEGVRKLNSASFAELAQYCRKLGFDRILFGTDYPLYTAGEYLEVLIRKLKLTEEEVIELLESK